MTYPHTNGHFIFREINSTNDLLAAFRLRYNVYRNSRLKAFCPPNSDQLDVDPWDRWSRHFGLFDSCGNLAAALRVITTNLQPANIRMFLLSPQHRSVKRALIAGRAGLLPIATAFQQPDACRGMVEQAVFEKRTIVETGRLVVEPRRSGPALASCLATAILAIGFFGKWGVDIAVHTCNTSHKNLYTGLGFDNIPGTTDTYWDRLRTKGSALMASRNNVPRSMHLILRVLAERFETSEHIVIPASCSPAGFPATVFDVSSS